MSRSSFVRRASVIGTSAALVMVVTVAIAATAERSDPSGREIYQRYLANKFGSLAQHLTVISTDPGGNPQVTEMLVRWKDFRDEHMRAREGVISKTVVRFIEPFDVRRLTYLIVGREGMPHDQFVYTPSTKRTRRIQVRGVGVMGTDYTIDDLSFQTIEDADYERLPDETIDGIPVYTVRARLKPHFETQYPVVTMYLDQERSVPLRALYEGADGVLLRELQSNAETVQKFGDVWVPTQITVTNVRERTSSTVLVHHLEPNAELDDTLFSSFRLYERAWR